MYSTQALLKDLRGAAAVRSPAKFYIYALLVGIFSGFLALGFAYAAAYAEEFTFYELAGVDLGMAEGEITIAEHPAELEFRPLLFFLLPIVGFFISGFLEDKFAPAIRGQTTDFTINAFHERAGLTAKRIPVIKTLATIATLASGGSAGREGPMSLVGASAAGWFSRLLGLGPKAARSLFLAGMAGTLGAFFQAPLGAALLTVEILYRDDFESESLIPCVISSIAGYFVYTSFVGFEPLFSVPNYVFREWPELIFYSILAMACFGFGYAFVRLKKFTTNLFAKLPAPFYIRTAVGGFCLALIGLVSIETLGTGYGFLQSLMKDNEIANISRVSPFLFEDLGFSPFFGLIFFLGSLVILKLIATSITVGCGASGGIFGPSLFIGGILGAIVGMVGNYFFPEIVSTHIPYIVVGMGGFIAGIANTPITAIIMVCELTGSYQLLPAMMTVAVLSLVFSSRFTIYPSQPRNRFSSPAHAWDMTQDYLKEQLIGDAIDTSRRLSILDSRRRVKDLYRIATEKQVSDFIIEEHGSGKYLGMLSLRHVADDHGVALAKSTHQVGELIEVVVPPLYPENSVAQGLEMIINWDLDKIPVTDHEGILLGYLTFRDILQNYRRSVTRS